MEKAELFIHRSFEKLVINKPLSERNEALQGSFVDTDWHEHINNRSIIILGEPGSGKTEFSKALHNKGEWKYVTARDFIQGRSRMILTCGMPLIIDGLDEYRSGVTDKKSVLEDFSDRIFEYKVPKHILTCRASDWYSHIDTDFLSKEFGCEPVVLRIKQFNDEEIKEYFSHLGIQGAEILNIAQKKGIIDLLRNPQTLSFFCEIFLEKKSLPSSRKEIFKQACRIMATEHGKRDGRFSSDKILNSAGKLFALLLLSNRSTIVIEERDEDNDSFCGKLLHENREDLKTILDTKLFVPAGEDAFAPIHRTVAEFLGASFLSDLCQQQELSPRRLAGILISDHNIPTALRGIAGWLITLNTDIANKLFFKDPLAIFHHGDIEELPTEQKESLIHAIRENCKKRPGFPGDYDYPKNLEEKSSGLWDDKLINSWLDILHSNEESWFTVRIIISAINKRFNNENSIKRALLNIIWRNDIRDHDRCTSVKILLTRLESNFQDIIDILNEINAGKIIDADQELRGIILKLLYPDKISPDEIYQYLTPIKKSFIGDYYMFLKYDLISLTPTNRLHDLVDTIIVNNVKLGDNHYPSHWEFMWELILLTLENTVGINFLTVKKWLESFNQNHYYHIEKNEHKIRLKQWLQCNTGIIDQLWRNLSQIESKAGMVNESKMFFKLQMPQPSRIFYENLPEIIAKSLSIGSKSEEEFFSTLLYCTDQNLLVDDYFFSIFDSIGNMSDALKNIWENSRFCPLSYKLDDHHKAKHCKKSTSSILTQFVQDNYAKIYIGEPLGLLSHLAKGYLYGYIDFEPEDRTKILEELIGFENSKHVKNGFNAVLYRIDLPTPEKVVELASKSKVHLVYFPVLVALRELAKNDPNKIRNLSSDNLKFSVAIWATKAYPEDNDWFGECIKAAPQLVADTLLFCWNSFIYSGCVGNSNIDSIDDEIIRQISSEIAFTLINSKQEIPWKYEQFILKSALRSRRHHTEIVRIIQGYFLHSQPISPYGRNLFYLSICFFLGSTIEDDYFIEVIRQSNTFSPLSRLTDLLSETGCKITLKQRRALAIGLAFYENELCTSGRKFCGETAEEFLREHLIAIASTPGEKADIILNGLSNEPILANWKNIIFNLIEERKRKSVDERANFPNPKELLGLLNGGPPVSNVDFRDILLDMLFEFQDELNGGKDNLFNQFWNKDKPLTENTCRDVLTSHIRLMLRVYYNGIGLFREDQYKDDKRADITFTYGRMEIPLEAKGQWNKGKDGKKGVWGGIPDQLIPYYCSSPESKGYGIFLVFWFGEGSGKDLAPPPPVLSIEKPQSPDELISALRLTVPEGHEDKISIVCLDCSKQ